MEDEDGASRIEAMTGVEVASPGAAAHGARPALPAPGVRSLRTRLFLTCWVLYALHFATNIVREHYPAFSLIERGDFVLDRYVSDDGHQPVVWHSDIFRHRDGHYYIGNQVLASVIAAGPLLVFDPLLDALERRERARDPAPARYETEYGNRQVFLRRVAAERLTLRFGGAAVVTSTFLMAPLCALAVLLVLSVLSGAGVARGRALTLSLLFAFATPLFYRAAHLNHNVFVMLAVFGSFLCVWRRPDAPGALPGARAFWGGFLAGTSLALDYAGVVPLLIFFAHVLADHRHDRRALLRRGALFVAGSVPPVIFLCASQWAMYGDPFLPGQWWMPEVNYTDEGWRGFGLPDPEVFWLNLVSFDYGLLPFAPLLLLLAIPRRPRPFSSSATGRGWPTGTALFTTWIFIGAFLLFCAANQYSRMQWNSGFRYLLPLIPFLFLLLAPLLARLSRPVLLGLGVPAVVHEWVLCLHRYTPPDRLSGADEASTIVGSWRRFAEQGVEFPWLGVLRGTESLRIPGQESMLFGPAILFFSAALIAVIWRVGARPSRPEKAQ